MDTGSDWWPVEMKGFCSSGLMFVLFVGCLPWSDLMIHCAQRARCAQQLSELRSAPFCTDMIRETTSNLRILCPDCLSLSAN